MRLGFANAAFSPRILQLRDKSPLSDWPVCLRSFSSLLISQLIAERGKIVYQTWVEVGAILDRLDQDPIAQKAFEAWREQMKLIDGIPLPPTHRRVVEADSFLSAYRQALRAHRLSRR